MCGISGLVNCGDSETLWRMTCVQAHRGPDDVGIWEQRFPTGSYVGLGSRRLAIIDLSASGHMPMSNEDGTVWITYNGEIYNFAELRHELEGKGHRFASNSDTEVIIHLYEEEGADCVKRLNGIFAFGICDLRSGEPLVFLARDHFGVKPLYYVQQGPRFAFASEIKALLQVSEVEAQIDVEALHQYLTFLWVPDPKTMFRGILKLPAGHHALLRGGQIKVTKYWDLTFPSTEARFTGSEADLAAEIRERFRRSVEMQMISDVPVAAFLSAGLDSSSIVAMMSRVASHPVQTYTITFPTRYRIGETTLDNPDVAARSAAHFGCQNQRIIVEPDVAGLLPKLTWHMDEPTADPAIITAYLVCKEARKNATVLLSGVGGDELFAGYRKHYAHYWARAYHKIPAVVRGAIDASLLHLPSFRGTAVKGKIRLAKKMARSARLPAEERFIMNCTYLDQDQKLALYTAGLSERLAGADPAMQHRDRFEQVKEADFLNQMLYLDTKIFMVSLNLAYNDKMSMASSVEVRVPFLDRELVEFVAWRVPPKMKIKGFFHPTTKYIFRRAMEDVLPPEVLAQPKAGFAAPIDYWLAHDLNEMVGDLLSQSRLKKRAIFRPDAIHTLLEQHKNAEQDWSMQIWQLLTLEIWMEQFLDNNPRNMTTTTPGFDQAKLSGRQIAVPN